VSDSERQPSDILWSPPPARVVVSAMTKLMTDLAGAHGAPRDNDAAFHRWTVKHSDLLWRHVWDDCGIVGDPGEVVVEESDKMPGARWFPEASLNYAENLLRARQAYSTAVIFRREDGQEQRLTYKDLCDQVSRCAQLLKAAGVTAGDRVAAYMPNCPETVIAMLAAASLGAVFSSASPDFGSRGVLDRFGQIEPKVLIAANGKTHSRTDTAGHNQRAPESC
jgi:acetoacetyl-CoA synthetase